MSKSKSTRGRKAAPVPSISPDPPPESELQLALDSFGSKFNDALCVLHCMFQTLEHADDVLNSVDLSRALNVAYQCSRTFDALEEKLDAISLRIAHEGIPAQYPKTSGVRS